MKKEYILFIDSGVGGLSTLSKCYKVLPTNYIYFADNKHSPYGSHSDEEIFNYLEEIVCSVSKSYNIVFVVLACNTATTSAINKLRDRFFDVKFIGTEPAIKVCSDSGFKHILSIATPTTIKQPKYKKLVLSSKSKIKNLPLSNFASSIEEYFISKNFYSYFIMQKNIYKIAHTSKNFDCLSLGCTHYVLVKDFLSKIINIPAFDGNLGVLKQVLFYHAKFSKLKPQKPSIKFLVSDKKKTYPQIYKKIFQEILAKI